MEKIIITKKQEASLLYALDKYGEEALLNTHFHKEVNGELWGSIEFLSLNDLKSIDLAKALFGGYEVEETPEVKLLNIYKYFDSDTDHDSGLRYGILQTLDILGIRIKGINE